MIDFTNLKSLSDARGVITKVTDKLDNILWQAITYKNWVKYSTEADGVTIYNGGLGYKDDYRIRSGGTETTANKVSCTGFIPVKGGDSVYFSGWDFAHVTAGNSINAADASFTNIGQVAINSVGYGIFASGAAYVAYNRDSIVEVKTGVLRWIVPPAASGVAYIRVSGFTEGDGSKMIITINEEIPL